MGSIYVVCVDFWLSGESFSFSDATDVIGIEPTHTRTKEEFKVPDFAATEWSYETGYEKTNTVWSQLEKIYELLKDKTGDILNYCTENSIVAGFTIIVQSQSHTFPIMSIPPDFARLAAEMNAKIDFAIYPCLEERIFKLV